MNVGELKKKLEKVPDNVILVVPGNDHSYRECEVILTTGLYNNMYGEWIEDFGEEYTPEYEYGTRYQILLIE